jgi:putative endonuclease
MASGCVPGTWHLDRGWNAAGVEYSMFSLLRRWFKNIRKPKTLGRRGEVAAARFLRRKGYQIIARGERDPFGEIDLIAVDGRTVVFVEVKTRSSHAKGHPAEAVDRHKQHRLTRAALSFLKRHKLLECAARFDVVAVTWPVDQKRPLIEHFPRAFEPIGRFQFFS